MAKNGLTVLFDRTAEFLEGVKVLTTTRVLVGVPADKAGRSEAIDNASLAYIHDRGAPEANIPARPFMKPGIASVQDKIEAGLKKAGELALSNGGAAVARQYERVGTLARDAIKRKINEGIPPPLAESTLKARARRGRKGAVKELARRAKGLPADIVYAKPLIDTGQLRNAISYVVRKK